MSIINDIKSEFRKDNMVTQLIMVNVAVFLLLLFIRLALTFTVQDREMSSATFYSVVRFLAAPYDLKDLVFRPWTPLTAMFLQHELMHLFWNMVFLFWFGKVLREYFGNRKILPVYVYGGLAGFAVSLLFHHLMPGLFTGSRILGSSAAVYAVLFALAALVPDYAFYLIFIGPVKVKYIVAFRVVIDLIFLSNMDNMGGSMAHLGGGLMGYYFIARHRNGKDLSAGFNRFADRLVMLLRPRRGGLTVSHRRRGSASDEAFRAQRAARQEELDGILDKISRSGYESLSAKEKETLFRYGRDD